MSIERGRQEVQEGPDELFGTLEKRGERIALHERIRADQQRLSGADSTWGAVFDPVIEGGLGTSSLEQPKQGMVCHLDPTEAEISL